MNTENKGGRPPKRIPPKRINWQLIESMLIMGSTGSDIADMLAISRDHFYRLVRREKGIPLSAW